MTHPTRQALDAAIADAQRGHRPSEWERVAGDLAAAAIAYVDHVEEKRAEQPKGLQQMQDEITAWCERKGWRGEGSAPVTFGDTMALLHSEVSEALEAYRDWKLKDATADPRTMKHDPRCPTAHLAFPSQGDMLLCTCEEVLGHSLTPKPEGVGSEFADILIRLLDDCDRWGIDLAFEYERKMAYNERRPYQHGGRVL